MPRRTVRADGAARVGSELCDIVAVPVATIHGSADGSHLDPGNRLVMASDGRYFTTSAYDQQIIEWDRNGAFVRAAGTTGDGPGELSARGALMLFIDDADSLFVLDGGGKWTVFDSELNYVRSFADNGSGRDAGAIAVLGGEILSTAPSVSAARFHATNRTGTAARAFGPATEAGMRLVATEGNSAFWTTPRSGEGITLERWTTAGAKTRTLTRTAEWLPESGYGDRRGDEPELPEYDMLHRTPDGLLWVSVIVRDARWHPVDVSQARALEQELYDARVEVIDPVSATVAASYVYNGPPDTIPPFARFLPGTRRSYRIVSDTATGLRRIEIFDIYLAARK